MHGIIFCTSFYSILCRVRITNCSIESFLLLLPHNELGAAGHFLEQHVAPVTVDLGVVSTSRSGS